MSDNKTETIHTIQIEDELRQSYLDYAMSVIVSRALPDVRDGLKPVHRRILHAMRELKNSWDKPYKKSARVVGDVIGKYHPHGDTAVYSAIVRMAQFFAMRYTLIEGQGNFGSVDGDAPAAMRYTEIRMCKITESLLDDLDKETVDFVPNYDNTETIPAVLPARIPNLLINGSSGIAVALATNIPPHNINEVMSGLLALLENPAISIAGLMKYILAPDFPTAAIIQGTEGVVNAYNTGKGSVTMRARYETVSLQRGREAIIVHEIPYQVNKAKMIEHIAVLVRDKKLTGISELRDESDKDGIRVVIELRRGEIAEVVMNTLYAHTDMQRDFNINMVALDGGRPKLMNLKQVLEAFLSHRREIIVRRTVFLLRKARLRMHLLEGLSVAADNINEIVSLIRISLNSEEARNALLARAWQPSAALIELIQVEDYNLFKPASLSADYGLHTDQSKKIYRLSLDQVKAILELRLQRLTALEQSKIYEEYKLLTGKIKEYLLILSGGTELQKIVRQELEILRDEYKDERRTEIKSESAGLDTEHLIPDVPRIVTLSHRGYITSQELDAYRAQKRGGVGLNMASVRDDDGIAQIIMTRTHDTLLCFSDWGKVYWLRVYDIPLSKRTARGQPLVNLLNLSDAERITAILRLNDSNVDEYIVTATKMGVVKRMSMKEFSNPARSGKRAMNLSAGDRLIGVRSAHVDDNVMLFSSAGLAVCFQVSDLRIMGRNAGGVRGMRLNKDETVVSLLMLTTDKSFTLCIVSEAGYGKCTKSEEFTAKGRGGRGVIAQDINEVTGPVVRALEVDNEDEIMFISNHGTAVRLRAAEISIFSRTARGTRLMDLRKGGKLVAAACIKDNPEDNMLNNYDE